MRNLRKTTESFIKEISIKHNNFYNYENVIYEGCMKNINIVCPLHGKFKQKASLHLFGQGCPKCGLTKNRKSNTLEFIKKATIKHHNFYNYSKVIYDNAKEDVIIICPLHGEFKQKPNYHLSGNGCTICYNLEKALHKTFRDLKYHPILKFRGSTECFLVNKKIIEYEF